MIGLAALVLVEQLGQGLGIEPARLCQLIVEQGLAIEHEYYLGMLLDRATGRAEGRQALMRIDPAHGVIEIGFVAFSPALQRTPLSTEANFLLLRYVFEQLGYRRTEESLLRDV